MTNPGDDCRIRSQTTLSFITTRRDFERESGDVPTSTPSGSKQGMVKFFIDEERRAQKEEDRAEREAQQW